MSLTSYSGRSGSQDSTMSRHEIVLVTLHYITLHYVTLHYPNSCHERPCYNEVAVLINILIFRDNFDLLLLSERISRRFFILFRSTLRSTNATSNK